MSDKRHVRMHRAVTGWAQDDSVAHIEAQFRVSLPPLDVVRVRRDWAGAALLARPFVTLDDRRTPLLVTTTIATVVEAPPHRAIGAWSRAKLSPAGILRNARGDGEGGTARLTGSRNARRLRLGAGAATRCCVVARCRTVDAKPAGDPARLHPVIRATVGATPLAAVVAESVANRTRSRAKLSEAARKLLCGRNEVGIAVGARARGDSIIGVHLDLLCRGALPRGVTSTGAAFCLPQLYHRPMNLTPDAAPTDDTPKPTEEGQQP